MTPATELLPLDLSLVCHRIERGRRFQRELLMQPDPHAELTNALTDAIELFQELGVEYALVGGIAAMCYGRTRFTEHVDFIAATDHQSRLAAHPDVMRRHRFAPSCTWKLYHNSGMEVDIWKDEFADQMIRRATTTNLAGVSVRIVDVHDLIAMKLRAGRQRDDYDVSEICKRTAIDESRLRALVVPDVFARFQNIKRRSDAEM